MIHVLKPVSLKHHRSQPSHGANVSVISFLASTAKMSVKAAFLAVRRMLLSKFTQYMLFLSYFFTPRVTFPICQQWLQKAASLASWGQQKILKGVQFTNAVAF